MSFCESQEIQDLKCSDERFAVDDGFMYTLVLLTTFILFFTLPDPQEWLCLSLQIFHLQILVSL